MLLCLNVCFKPLCFSLSLTSHPHNRLIRKEWKGKGERGVCVWCTDTLWSEWETEALFTLPFQGAKYRTNKARMGGIVGLALCWQWIYWNFCIRASLTFVLKGRELLGAKGFDVLMTFYFCKQWGCLSSNVCLNSSNALLAWIRICEHNH